VSRRVFAVTILRERQSKCTGLIEGANLFYEPRKAGRTPYMG